MKTDLPIVALMLLLFADAARAEESFASEQLVGKLVASFGIDRWDRVEAIRFTFNVKKGDTRVYRTWHWSPKTNVVKFSGPLGDEKLAEIEYDRDELGEGTAERIREIDAKFINDSFWLLLPLHLSWSKDVTLEYTGYAHTPLRKRITREVIVRYPDDAGGYTPGDMYKLYLDEAWRIEQWSYHKAGAVEPTLATIWKTDQKVGPLVLTTDFVGRDESFGLWFTKLAVKTTDGDGWIEAEAIDHPCRTCR